MPLMEVNVRPVRRDDRSQWEALWEGYNAFYGRTGRTALAPEVSARTWARFFDDHEPVHALVAVRNERLLGLSHFVYHRSTTRIADVCYLQDLFTDPTSRGDGVGRLLIEATADAARQAGSTRLYWQTQADNHMARRLYDRMAKHLGFIVYTRELE